MQAELLEGVSEQTRQRILEAAHDESFAKGDFMFRLGEPARHFYILGEGRVRLTLGQGERVTYVASSPSELIGWSSLVDNESYTASAECLVPVKVLKIEKAQLDEVLLRDRASGMAFYKNLAAIIGRRLIKCYQATLMVYGSREAKGIAD